MSNDTFDPQNKSNERKEFRHLPPNGNIDQRRYAPEEQDYRIKPKNRSNVTSIALAIVSSLCMCVIGYEVVRYNLNSAEIPKSQIQAKKKSVFISTPETSASHSTTSFFEGEDEDYHLHILKEQNKQQVAKIKALRHELMEKMQQVHEIKANLFKYDGALGDKSKIVDLQRDIAGKQQHNEQLKLKIFTMEQEAADLEKKITQLEVTRDTLMGMIESQRVNSGQEVTSLKQQIQDLTHVSKADKTDLEKKVQTLELTQEHLTESLGKKSFAIEVLEKNLTSHQQQLAERSEELQQLLQRQQFSPEDALNLISNIEFELTAKEIARKDFITALDEKASLIRDLEKEIVYHQIVIANKGSLLTQQEQLANEKAADYLLALELEALRTQQLQQEHGKAVQQINELKAELQLKNSQAFSADEQILNLANLYTYDQQLAESQLQGLVSSHEFESTKVHLIHNQLQEAQSKVTSLEEILEELQSASFTSLQHNDQLSRQLAAKELHLANHELQLRSLAAMHQDGQQQGGEQARRLADVIETERLQNARLAEELAESQKKYELQEEIAHLLGARLDDVVLDASRLEENLLSTKVHLEHKEGELSRTLNEKAALENHVNDLKEAYEERLADRELQLRHLGSANEERQLHADEQARMLAEVIETERLHSGRLTEELTALHKKYDAEEELANVLEEKLEEIALEAGFLEEALLASKAFLEQKELELARTLSDKLGLEGQVSSLKQLHEEHLADRELQISNLGASHAETQQQADEQARRLVEVIETERLQSGRLADELSAVQKKHAAQEELSNLLGLRLEEIVFETSQLEGALQISQTLLEQKELALARTLNEKNHLEGHLGAFKQIHEEHLADREFQLRNLGAAHAETQQQADEQARMLVEVIETERLQNGRLANELLAVQKKYAAQEELADLLDQRLEEIVLEANQLEEALQASQDLLEKKESELSRVLRDKNDLEDHVSSLIELHEEHLANRELQLKNLGASHTEAKQQADEQAKELADAIEAERQQGARLREELAAVHKKYAAQEELANLLGARLEEIVAEANQLEEALLASKALAEEKERQLAFTMDAKASADDHIEALKQRYADDAHRAATLETDLGLTLQQLSDKESIIARLTKAFEMGAEERGQLEIQLEGQNAEKERLQQRIAELTSQKEVNEKQLAEELHSLGEKHDSKHQEAEFLNDQLAQIATEAALLEERLVHSQKLLEQRESDLVQARSEHHEVRGKLSEQERLYIEEMEKVSYLENDLAVYLKKASELENALDGLSEKVKAESSGKLLLKSQLDAATKAFEEAQEEVHHLTEYMTRLSIEADSLQNSLENTHDQLEENLAKAEHLEALLRHERLALSNERQEKQLLNAELLAAREKLEQIMKTVQENTATVDR